MTTSNGLISPSAPTTPGRGPLRLRMTGHPGADRLDGGWWPRTRNLAVELADLVEHFPPELGRIARALFSPPDWDSAPRRIPVAHGYVKVGSFPRDDTHLVILTTTNRTVLHVLVVPPGLAEDRGAEALLAAATPGNTHSATEVLDEVAELPDASPEDHWTDDGGSWWGSGSAPSYRTGG